MLSSILGLVSLLNYKLKPFLVYATLAYIRHFIFAGCYDNDPWYLVTNFAGHLDLAGFYFSNAPLILNAPLNLLLGTRYRPSFSSCDGRRPNFKYIDFASAWTRAPPDRNLMLYQWAMDAIHILCLRFYLTSAHSCFGGFFKIVLAHFLHSAVFCPLFDRSRDLSWRSRLFISKLSPV